MQIWQLRAETRKDCEGFDDLCDYLTEKDRVGIARGVGTGSRRPSRAASGVGRPIVVWARSSPVDTLIQFFLRKALAPLLDAPAEVVHS